MVDVYQSVSRRHHWRTTWNTKVVQWVLLSRDLVILEPNPGWCEAFGYGEDELRGTPLAAMTHFPDRAKLLNEIESFLAGRNSRVRANISLMTSTGRRIDKIVHCLPMRAGHTTNHFLLIAMDVPMTTEQLESLEEFKEGIEKQMSAMQAQINGLQGLKVENHVDTGNRFFRRVKTAAKALKPAVKPGLFVAGIAAIIVICALMGWAQVRTTGRHMEGWADGGYYYVQNRERHHDWGPPGAPEKFQPRTPRPSF